MRTIRTLAVTLVALIAVPLFAASANLVDDVIRMYKSGVPEDAIIQFVQKANTRFDVNADDLIALSDAKVPRTVIKAVLDEADVRNGRENVRDTRTADGSRTTVVVSPGYGYGYYGYAPYWYDPWFYDPFYYGGRFSVGVNFGHFGGGGFRGGHSGGGHSGGGHSGGGHGHH
jgi:hypothetical protein